MNGPTSHLCWKELACHDGTPYPLAWRASRAVVLGTEFERIRAMLGQPITIGSAYRTVTHNAKVGGARHSQHLEGRALDLYPPKGCTVARLYAIVRSIANDPMSNIAAIGLYRRFIHVDTREPRADGRLTVWQGSRAWAEKKVA